MQDSANKLARYAHIPSSSQDTSRQDANPEGSLLQVEGSEEEGSDTEGACFPHKETPATRPKARGWMENTASLQFEQAEPTLKDVFQAVNKSNTTLSSLILQFSAFKEDITHIRHDIRKASERATLTLFLLSVLFAQSP